MLYVLRVPEKLGCAVTSHLDVEKGCLVELIYLEDAPPLALPADHALHPLFHMGATIHLLAVLALAGLEDYPVAHGAAESTEFSLVERVDGMGLFEEAGLGVGQHGDSAGTNMNNLYYKDQHCLNNLGLLPHPIYINEDIGYRGSGGCSGEC